MAAILSPDTKNLSFLSQAERITAHQLLQKALAVSNVNLNIKKENIETVADGHSGTSSDVLPKLPSLDSECVVQQGNVACADDEMLDDGVYSAKKMKCSDLEDWFDDAI